MNKTIVWKFVEKDGLPEPDNYSLSGKEKTYFVVWLSGFGYGSYRGSYSDPTKLRWYLDFDAVGYEDEIIAYFEIPWYGEDE